MVFIMTINTVHTYIINKIKFSHILHDTVLYDRSYLNMQFLRERIGKFLQNPTGIPISHVSLQNNQKCSPYPRKHKLIISWANSYLFPWVHSYNCAQDRRKYLMPDLQYSEEYHNLKSAVCVESSHVDKLKSKPIKIVHDKIMHPITCSSILTWKKVLYPNL